DRLAQALGILAAVLELQRVDGKHLMADLVAPFGIEQQIESLASRQAHVVPAFRADVQVRFEVGRVEHRVARRALHPDSFGDLLAACGRSLDARRQKLVEPGHRGFPGSGSGASSAARIDATNARARCGACSAGPSRSTSIVRVPMITASAARATARAVAPSRMPKPTPTGSEARARIDATRATTSSASSVPPVVPFIET